MESGAVRKVDDLWYDTGFLDPERLEGVAGGGLRILSSDVQRCCALATRAFGWTLDQKSHPVPAASALLFRQTLDRCDATSILIRHGSGESARVVLRSMLESTLSLKFVLANNPSLRSRCYEFYHLKEVLRWQKIATPGTAERREFEQAILHDESMRSSTLGSWDVRAASERIEKSLSTGEFAEIEGEIMKRRSAKRRHKEWYNLFDGPDNVADLAKRVGHAGMYAICYRQWSQDVHGSGSIRHLSASDQRLYIRPARYPEDIQTITLLACGLMLEATRLLVEAYCPDRREQMVGAYTLSIEQRFKRLTLFDEVQVLDTKESA